MDKDIPIKEFQLTVPWGHVAAKAWGFSKGIPVLVVHGRLDNAGSFNRLIPQLPDGFYFVCIDLPGHGHSSFFPVGMPLDFFQYSFTIRCVLDELQWKTCIYIGHSFGAQLGIIFAIIYPERIEKLVCIDDMFFKTDLRGTKLFRYIRECHDNAIQMEDALSSSKTYTREQVLHALQYLRLTTINLEAAEALFERAVTKVGDVYKYNRDPRLKVIIKSTIPINDIITVAIQLKIPILMLVASATINTLPATIKNKFNRIAGQNKKSIVIVEGNHDVHNNHPERVAPHICKFLNNYKSNL